MTCVGYHTSILVYYDLLDIPFAILQAIAFYRHDDGNLNDEDRRKRLGTFLERSPSDLSISGGATFGFLIFHGFCPIWVFETR